MRLSVVHDDDVVFSQLGSETATDPVNEALTVCGLEHCAECDPAPKAHRADHREVGPPIGRTKVEEFFPTPNPGVAASHRDIGAGFIEKHEPIRVDFLQSPFELATLCNNVRSLLLGWAYPFFLKT